jgi:hypothetical protein
VISALVTSSTSRRKCVPFIRTPPGWVSISWALFSLVPFRRSSAQPLQKPDGAVRAALENSSALWLRHAVIHRGLRRGVRPSSTLRSIVATHACVSLDARAAVKALANWCSDHCAVGWGGGGVKRVPLDLPGPAARTQA